MVERCGPGESRGSFEEFCPDASPAKPGSKAIQDDGMQALFAAMAVQDHESDICADETNSAVRILHNPWFIHFINTCIFVNCVMVSVEQSSRISGGNLTAYVVVENICLTVFLFELCLRIRGSRQFSIHSWFVFDAFVVAVAVLANWVVPVLSMIFPIHSTDDISVWFSLPLVLRTARLTRLVRALRLVNHIGQLWLLVKAFLTSARMICYVAVMMGAVLYIFNALAVELITLRYMSRTDVPVEVQEVVSYSFPDVSMTFLTLIQFVCLDSVADIYRPLAAYDWTLAIFFMMLILIVGIVFMNIITAVIVDAAFQVSNEDAEFRGYHEMKAKEEQLSVLYEMFLRCDKDNSGQLTLEELVNVGDAEAQILREVLGDIKPEEAFKMLDVDDNGEIGIGEFCNGLYEAQCANSKIEIKRVFMHVKQMHKEVCSLRATVDLLLPEGARNAMATKSSEAFRRGGTHQGEFVDFQRRSRRTALIKGRGKGGSSTCASSESISAGEPHCDRSPHGESWTTSTNGVHSQEGASRLVPGDCQAQLVPDDCQAKLSAMVDVFCSNKLEELRACCKSACSPRELPSTPRTPTLTLPPVPATMSTSFGMIHVDNKPMLPKELPNIQATDPFPVSSPDTATELQSTTDFADRQKSLGFRSAPA